MDGLNDPVVKRYLIGPGSRHQTMVSVREYVRADWERDDAILFGLFVQDVLRGTVRLHGILDVESVIGIALFDHRVWGQGWAGRAVKMIVRFAFDSLGVTCIKAGLKKENIASRRLFNRSGFQLDHERLEGDLMAQIWKVRSNSVTESP